MEQTNIEETGVRLFLKELQKHDFYYEYMVERMRHGDKNPHQVIQSLVASLSDCRCEGTTPQKICRNMLRNFNYTQVSFVWSNSQNGTRYWVYVWDKLTKDLKPR